MGPLARLLLSRRWQESKLREDMQGVVLLLGSFFGHQPPHIDPLPTVIGTPLESDQEADQLPVRPPGDSQNLL
ncbi:MAG: hypothetical protein ACYCX9_02785 [Candidatus Dormibacteria bacterium]